MESVQINRTQLLGIVQENMTKHVAEYLEAVEDHKTLCTKIANENIKLAKSNLKKVEAGELDKIESYKALPQKPSSYESDYKRAIRMLELSVDTVIDVSEEDFNQLVLDEWTWKRAFIMSNTTYKAGIAR